mgnify:CR=1 FL=1
MSSFLSLTRCIKDIGWIPIGKELGGPEDRDYRFSSMYKVSKSNKKFRFAKFFITQLFIRNCFHWESEVGWGSGQGSGISRGSLEIGCHPPIHPLYPRSSPIHPRSPDSGSPSIPILPIDPGVPIRSIPTRSLEDCLLARLSIRGCVSCFDTS